MSDTEAVAEVCWLADRPGSMLELRGINGAIRRLPVGTKLYTRPVPEGCAVIDIDDLRAILSARERGFGIDYIEGYVRSLVKAAKRQEVENESD
jgi:hypothetical protein